MQKIIYPKKIVDYKNATAVENLKIAKSLQIGLNEPDLTEIGEGGYVVLDFGKELCGSLRILAHVGEGEQKA